MVWLRLWRKHWVNFEEVVDRKDLVPYPKCTLSLGSHILPRPLLRMADGQILQPHCVNAEVSELILWVIIWLRKHEETEWQGVSFANNIPWRCQSLSSIDIRLWEPRDTQVWDDSLLCFNICFCGSRKGYEMEDMAQLSIWLWQVQTLYLLYLLCPCIWLGYLRVLLAL